MSYKVQLTHTLSTEVGGLYRQRVVGISTATIFDTYAQANDAGLAWLTYGGGERAVAWSATVVPAEVAA